MTQSIGPPSLAQGTRIAVGFSTSISRFIPACGELTEIHFIFLFIERFIPAYAGNSVSEYREKCGIAVHPRLRGELGEQKNPGDSTDGSSPLTRGTQRDFRERKRLPRFIPAYAGNSLRLAWRLLRLTVHPRLRGELR